VVSEFMEKARDNLKAAQLCLENGFLNASANRAYYAAFHAAVAILAHKGFRKDRIDHEWAQAQFNAKLIRGKKVFPSKIKSYLPDMQSIRNIADYREINVGKKAAVKQVAKATEMVGLIAEEMDRK
jgi:uncharacterized protein (UPF0332 family)